MSELVGLGIVGLAGLACPVHMWWSHRRGREAACCRPPDRFVDPDRESGLEVVRARQRRLGAMIAAHDRASTEARE